MLFPKEKLETDKKIFLAKDKMRNKWCKVQEPLDQMFARAVFILIIHF